MTDKTKELLVAKDLKSDFDFSRETYYDLVEKGREGIDEMMEVAKGSEHPRAYEVLSKLIKDTGDVADKLMDLNRKQVDIKRIKDGPIGAEVGGGTTNVFIGSTADLQRAIALEQKNNEQDITPPNGT
jgi:hypothetical protein